jgi:hypothetical protein
MLEQGEMYAFRSIGTFVPTVTVTFVDFPCSPPPPPSQAKMMAAAATRATNELQKTLLNIVLVLHDRKGGLA